MSSLATKIAAELNDPSNLDATLNHVAFMFSDEQLAQFKQIVAERGNVQVWQEFDGLRKQKKDAYGFHEFVRYSLEAVAA